MSSSDQDDQSTKWYISFRGQTQGPLLVEQVRMRIRSRELTAVDLCFVEGESRWQALGERPELRDLWGAFPPVPHIERRSLEQDPRDWVILKWSGEGSTSTQEGPLTEREILEALGRGQVHFRDFVWRPGFRRWARIGNLPQFDRRQKERLSDSGERQVNTEVALPKLPEVNEEDLLQNVIFLKPLSGPVMLAGDHDTPPAEAKGPDLARPTWLRLVDGGEESGADSAVTSSLEPRDRRRFQIITGGAGVSAQDRSEQKASPASGGKWSQWASVAAALVGLVGTVALLRERGSDSPAIDRRVASTVEPDRVSELSFYVASPEAEPRVVVKTDAAPSMQLWVNVIGLPGDVKGLVSLSRSFQLGSARAGSAELSLRQADLPPGRYTIEVFAGQMKRSQVVEVGMKSAELAKVLRQERERVRPIVERELALVRDSADQALQLADEVQGAWGSLAAEQRRQKSVSAESQKWIEAWTARLSKTQDRVAQYIARPNEEMAYPEDLRSVHLALDHLGRQARDLYFTAPVGGPSETQAAPVRELASQGSDLPVEGELRRLLNQANRLRRDRQ